MRLRMAYKDAVVTAVVIRSVLVLGFGRAWTARCMKSILGARVWLCVSWVVCSPGSS